MATPTAYEPWLANLNDPSKLTPQQKVDCGVVPGWTCNARKGRASCQALLSTTMKVSREKCQNLAAIAPPPLLAPPPPENPQADPAALQIAADRQGVEPRTVDYYQATGAPIDAHAAELELPLTPDAFVDRGQGTGPTAGILDTIPGWTLALAAAGLLWWVTRG